VAAGLGSRFGGERPKQLAPLAGRPVLTHSLLVFEACPDISEIILVLPRDWLEIIVAEAVTPYLSVKPVCVVGGRSRVESTRRGFEASGGDLLLIHDGVRPLISPDLVARVARAARERGAALAAVPVRDTLKKVENRLVGATVDRRLLWQAQTPQGFQRELLARALAGAGTDGATDDIELVQRLGLSAEVVSGSARNLKITTPEDLIMAEALMNHSACFRTGHGYDLHRLAEGRPLWLGGVPVAFERGLLGHSDADVLAHALVDALLGAAGLGDIGEHFPDKDDRWAGASGALLLRESMAKVRAAGWELVNADLTLVGEKPKIGPYRQAMKEALAGALSVAPAAVNVKATTTEGMDAVGRGLALAAYAAVALKNI
jgi:2-C-methyl-D-erythritol 4-phosphate cytidylyltransferase/2-C-methyl-D-erythritol 2,4-cyclodiphosphate synthase